MNKVFITQENSNFNYVPAEEFGQLIFMTSLEFSKHRDSQINRNILASIKAQVEVFNPKSDFVLLSGSPVINSAVFLALGKKFGYSEAINVLKWSNRDGVYQTMTIDLNNC